MDKVYEGIAYHILENARKLSIKLNTKLNIEIRILDVSKNSFEVLYKSQLGDEMTLKQIVEFSRLSQYADVFIDRLYNAFYQNTGLYLCTKNLAIYETNTDYDILSFDISSKRIKKVEEAYKKAFKFEYVYRKND